MPDNEMKPCPLCGAINVTYGCDWGDKAKCNECGCTAPISAWNVHIPANRAVKSDWVNCPVCGEPDMRKETDADGNALIHCVNHGCLSNGARAPAQSAGGGETLAARVEELVKRLRDAYAPQKFGVLPHRLMYKEAADLLEALSARAVLTDTAREDATTGFAVRYADGSISARSVSPSIIGAKVNGLWVAGRHVAQWPDNIVDKVFRKELPGAVVVPVEIRAATGETS